MSTFTELGISKATQNLVESCEIELSVPFSYAEKNALENEARVLQAFQKARVESRHFSGSFGYGYGDIGRDTLEAVYADVFGCEAALVRPSIISGTHAISACLYGLLGPGQRLLCATGKPYDTLEESIGLSGEPGTGSLRDWGVECTVLPLKNGTCDVEEMLRLLQEDPSITLIHMQRSRGYDWRSAFSAEDLGKWTSAAKSVRPDVRVFVDNCYGEFTETIEPTHLGVDLIAGSCIKNPGGGLAPTGGYIAGTKDSVDAVARHLFAPGIGAEGGSYPAGYRDFYEGLFLAPHTVKEALKTAILAASVFQKLGYKVSPDPETPRYDLIQAIELGSAEKLIAFCRNVQGASPIEGHVVPEPWPMPGYQDEVIMAAGTFIMGATSELSADGPLRAPYIAYMQGGLTYEHGKIALMKCVSALSGD